MTDERDMPIAEMNDKEVIAAIQKDCSIITRVIQTPERCLVAVKCGALLCYIAPELRTEELCQAAMEWSDYAFFEVPPKYLTREMCLKGIRVGCKWKSIPDQFRTPEFCVEAIKCNPQFLRQIPKAKQTEEMCLEAVSGYFGMFKQVSKKLLKENVRPASPVHDDVAMDRKNEFKKELCIRAMVRWGIELESDLERWSQEYYDYHDYYNYENRLREVYMKIPWYVEITPELCSAAVKQDGRALHFVPESRRTDVICSMAVETSGLTLYSVPMEKRSKDICITAIKQDGRALRFVPLKIIDKEMCDVAIVSYPLALKFVPENCKTEELCETAVQLDWKAFAYVPDSMYSTDACNKIYERMMQNHVDVPFEHGDENWFSYILERLSALSNSDSKIFRLRKEFDTRTFERKYYDKRTKKFVTEDWEEKEEFDTFPKFYDHLCGNLEGADLTDYDFEGVDFSEYDLDGAVISSAVQVKRGLYDDSFYKKNVDECEHCTDVMLSAENEIKDASSVLHENDIVPITGLTENPLEFNYISDIHINHKLLKKFPQCATEQEVEQYIKYLLNGMDADESDEEHKILLVAGDTSFNFKISSIFYNALREVWSGKIIVILGNHELWGRGMKGIPSNRTERLERIISKYRNMLESLGIVLLQNDLLLSDGTILSEKKLINIDPKELKDICFKNSYVILGGVGYSGLSQKFNATNGIYRETIVSLDEDVEQTKRFEYVYKKINDAIGDRQAIILTHMPKEDWSNENYNPNWIYVNGHTHYNDYYSTDEKTVYADNQVGYNSTSIGLKYFNTSGQYDIFRDYADGMYVISREEYMDFSRGKKIKMTFNRTNGKINMLKNHGMYCFIFEENSGKIFLLNGGMKTKLDHNDLNYYFERMPNYSNAIKKSVAEYYQTLKLVSDSIKSVGGGGTIHGCIIDIDYFNHIYVNPVDGKITPYYAISIIDKLVYSDVKALLMERRKDLYDNYIKRLNGNGENVLSFEEKVNAKIVNTSQYVPETQMYGLSRSMRSIQYLTDNNVIRIWNEQIANTTPDTKRIG